MARRRSLNRRWSRRSANGTGILNDDSNIIDDDDPLWWKRLENRTNSIRPSGKFTLGESSTASELNPNSTINDSEVTGDWWEVLQKTSQDFVPKEIDRNNSNTTSKRGNIISNTSDSETDDRLRETKKRKINFRKTRRSSGTNAFSQALDSSGPAIESEPALFQNSHALRTSFQSLDELPPRKTRQRSKNDSTLSHNSNSSDTDKIRKTRPKFLKKSRVTTSHTVFEDVLEGDESVIGPSQNVNDEKSNGESDVSSRRSSTRSRKKIIKQIHDKTPPSNNKSLSQSTKDVSLTREASNNKTSRSVLSSPANTERKQNQINESDGESEELVSQPRTHFRMNRRKKLSTNPFHSVLSDSDSALSISNKSLKNSSGNSLQLHLSPVKSEAISNSMTKSREMARIEQPPRLRRSKRYESDKASTTSISEELKTGKSSQQKKASIASNSSVVSNKMNTSRSPAISNEILQDSNSDDSDRLVSSPAKQKMNPKNANISEYNDTTELNDENREPKISTKKSQLDGELNVTGDSKRRSSLRSHSNTPAKQIVSNMSLERKKNSNEQNQDHPTRKSVRQKLNESSSENSTEESEIQSFQRKGRSGKFAIEESDASDEEIIIKNSIEKQSPSGKMAVEQLDVNEEENIIDSQLQKSSQEVEVSNERITSKKTKEKRSRSTKISDKESEMNDENIFNSKSLAHQSHSLPRAQYDLEENNNKELDSSQSSSPIAHKTRQSLRKTAEMSTRLSKSHYKVDEKNAESANDTDSDSEISRDPSAYELPDMNRSDSVTLSDSDNEDELPINKNTSGNRSPQKNHSPVRYSGGGVDRSPIKNKNNESKFLSKDIRAQPPEPLPSTSGIQKDTPVRKSLINPSRSRSSKGNISNNQRSILNFLTTCSSRAIPHEPLPTQEDVRDFKEKLKAVTGMRNQQKELHKEEVERELEQMRISLAKQKNLNKKKNPRKIIVRKKLEDPTKGVDKAFIVNGRVYKQPKLPRPKHWATDRLYKHLWKILEPRYKLETRVRSEKFVVDLSNLVTIVMRRKKYDNYKDEVDTLMKNMAHLGIINTRSDFYHFCYDFLPYEFRVKVTPILLPGNKRSIPYDPDTVDVPILKK